MRAALLCLYLSLIGAPAAALIDCRTADLTTRLLTLQIKLLQDLDTPERTLAEIESTLSGWSGHIGHQRDSPTAATDIRAVTDLTLLSYSLVRSTGLSSKVSAILVSRQAQTVRRLATVAVLRAACATSTGTRSTDESALNLSDTRMADAGSTSDSPSIERTTIATPSRNYVLPTMALGTGAILLCGFVIIRQLMRIHGQRRRRMRRYNVDAGIIIRTSAKQWEGRLLDISSYGLKLRHSGALSNGEKIDVMILGEWRTIRIAWHNAHYVGGTFDKPFSLIELLLIVASTKGRGNTSEPVPVL